MRSERLEGLKWKIKWRLEPVRKFLGGTDTQWERVVMDRATAVFVRGLGPETRDALEISGDKWEEIWLRLVPERPFPGIRCLHGDARRDVAFSRSPRGVTSD